MLDRILPHLASLVSFDTQNPPRAITAEHPIFDYLRRKLGTSFTFETRDLGNGCVWLLAQRGDPRVLFNFHLDTVPAAEGYTADPLTLRIEGDRAIGLGACDIKGASACMLAALEVVPDADVALLFTSDEEFGSSTCVRTYCAEKPRFDLVVVGEPTMGKAILEHRGIMTGTAVFTGVSGHASSGRAEEDSAVHAGVRWASDAIKFATDHEDRTYGPLEGVRFNLGRVEGGIKPNMIADRMEVRFGFRPLPGDDNRELFLKFAALAPNPSRAEFEPGFDAPPLPSPDRSTSGAEARARRFELPLADPVNFWTEASLFSEAGLDTFVFGPGDIAQAHTADEFVETESLRDVANSYVRILENL